ncbi:vacuolar ABC heavy metal transporter [Niveomyces insectorum RCEF 264]|uniref:Vacuolar ABC heavy metal transporter n=1 Tax=Niveomyces insectorum RCEF 264 TaxID=1081102 RepID=A0A167QWN0_9HYPO|nr:vacuolar ABC heavy metal transporter [Niveomyces insectorum RCEF 264]
MVPSVAKSLPEAILYRLELWYGLVLLVVFIVSIAANSILESRRANLSIRSAATGPGGRPLPVTRRKSQDSTGTASTQGLENSRAVKHLYLYASGCLVLSFLADFASVVFHTLSESRNPNSKYGWWCGEETSVYYTSGLFMHLYVLIYLLEADRKPNRPVATVWALALVLEAAIFVANIIRVNGDHQVLQSVVLDIWTTAYGPDNWDYLDIAIATFRIALLFFLLAMYSSAVLSQHLKCRQDVKKHDHSVHVDEADEAAEAAVETTPLISEGMRKQTIYAAAGIVKANGDASEITKTSASDLTNGYTTKGAYCGSANGRVNGSVNGLANGFANGFSSRSANGPANSTTKRVANASSDRSAAGAHAQNRGNSNNNETEETAFYRPEKLPHKTWWEYLTSYSLFFPYIWPRQSSKLKLVVVICFLILVVQRVVNFLVPNQIGNITDAFESSTGVPWVEILVFICYKLLQGQSGVLGSIRAFFWIPVSQYSYRALTTAAFEHVHSLSLDFHLGKRTGEVLSALNKGAAINSFLEQITFQVVPMLIDLLVAIFYFLFRFGAIYATIAAVITVFYLHMTIKMASTRADLRRDMVNADREEEAVKNDSITSYETVKYFNAEAFEFNRYRNAIRSFQLAEAKVTWGMNNMNICQALVFMCGILVMLMVAAIEVTQGLRSVGDFVVMITYLGQLQGPLNYFGSFYRTVQQAMISGERLLELFKIQPTVVDRPGVKALSECEGHIRWSNVQFWYDKDRTALRDLSFDCSPGTTTAFVGESGGGKSTIFRLMFRYYNCQSGTIEIDGHDVKDVTIDSVRRHIGVVPQDTILFNETIMYNLKYANPTVSDEEVYEACQVASIHDRILSFPKGYETKVGDRGTRLSGGEKQRVAIARAILKNPKVIMLDEATSALDSETEQQIQAKLIRGGSLGQNRTLLIIAHRLSTITHADQIIVLHAGAIVEKGTHNELLELRGRYASMWEKQSQAEQAAVAARDATARANKLMRQAHISNSPTQSRVAEDNLDGYTTSLSSSTVFATGYITPRRDSIGRSDESSDDSQTHSKPK